MTTKNRWLIGLALIAVLVLMAGCQPPVVPVPPAGQPAAITQEPVEEPVTVTLAYNRFLNTSFTDAPAPIAVIRAEVEKQYPNIEVQLNLMPDTINGMREALAVWITAEDPTVDIYGMDMPWVLEFGQAGWAQPLNDLVPSLDEDFIPAGVDVFSYQGQHLGVPFWSSISGTFYRKDLLEAAGFEPPATYDDMRAIAEAIMAENPDMSGFVWPGTKDEALVMHWSEFLLGFGGQYFDEAGNCAMNSPEGVAALTYVVDLIDSGVSPREVTAWAGEEARSRFVEGNAVFLRSNHDIATWLDDPARSAVAGKWAVMPNPAQPEGQPMGATGGFAFAMNPYTDSPDAAAKVLQVIASEPVQKGFAMAWGPVQYYQGLYEDPEVLAANPNADTIQPLLETATARPPSTRYAELSDIVQEEIHSAITGIKPVAEALDSMCQRIDALQQ